MKKLALVIFLIAINLISYYYLRFISDGRKEYLFKERSDVFLIQKKELILKSTDEFLFDDYFYVLSFDEPGYTYDFDETDINIDIQGRKYSYSYFVDEITIPESIAETDRTSDTVQIFPSEDNNISNNELQKHVTTGLQGDIMADRVESFILRNDHLCFDIDQDIDVIISAIYGSFDSAIPVHIDYSELNPSVPGIYTVLLMHGGNSDSLKVEIVGS